MLDQAADGGNSTDVVSQGGDSVAETTKNSTTVDEQKNNTANTQVPKNSTTNTEQATNAGQDTGNVGDMAGTPDQMVMEIATGLAQMLVSNPGLADKIATVIEEEANGMNGMGDAGLEQSVSTGGVAPEGPAAQPQAAPPNSGPALPPELLARIDTLERMAADARLNRELADASKRYGELRNHFGDVIPESPDENEILQTYLDLIEGKMPMHQVAVELLTLRKALGGDGPLKDRLVAAAAKSVNRPPALEGTGGSVAGAAETKETPKTSAEALRKARQLWEAMQGQPGS